MEDDLPDYANPEYWETRYRKDRGTFDWYLEWDAFFEDHLASLGAAAPVLVVGCGNSSLSMRIESSGMSPVISIDISRTWYRTMAQKTAG
jgi:hypothetical protein